MRITDLLRFTRAKRMRVGGEYAEGEGEEKFWRRGHSLSRGGSLAMRGVKKMGGVIFLGGGSKVSELTSRPSMRYYDDVGTVTALRSKTEQKIAQILHILQQADTPMTYSDLVEALGGKIDGTYGTMRGGIARDQLIYIMTTLVVTGLVTRSEITFGDHRPRYVFEWAYSHNPSKVAVASA